MNVTFLMTFLSILDNLPSTVAVVAAKASVVSWNFSKCLSLTLKTTKQFLKQLKYWQRSKD